MGALWCGSQRWGAICNGEDNVLGLGDAVGDVEADSGMRVGDVDRKSVV